MRKALMVWGGWKGHEPRETTEVVAEALRGRGFEVELSEALDSFKDEEKLKGLHLVVPCWTMGKIEPEQLKPVSAAVEAGVGLGGWHGGMCDAFREQCSWQWMTGGQWVAHPGGGDVTYAVRIVDREHPITKGLEDFEVTSEQYYLHVDPVVKVLAVTEFPPERNMGNLAPDGKPVSMPVAWTKLWGKGRVFYSSLGHSAETMRQSEVLEMTARGLEWAARE
jgi:type 1 glutamine amidotransferase